MRIPTVTINSHFQLKTCQTLILLLNSKLDKGQLIIYLFDKDEKLTDIKYAEEDGQLIFDCLIPGSYTMKLIYDKNNNLKWDTGDYLKNIQPERVLIYTKEIILKSNWDNEIDWKITTP